MIIKWDDPPNFEGRLGKIIGESALLKNPLKYMNPYKISNHLELILGLGQDFGYIKPCQVMCPKHSTT